MRERADDRNGRYGRARAVNFREEPLGKRAAVAQNVIADPRHDVGNDA